MRAEGTRHAGVEMTTRHAEASAGAPVVTVPGWDFGAVDGVDNGAGDFQCNEQVTYWDDDASFTCDEEGCGG